MKNQAFEDPVARLSRVDTDHLPPDGGPEYNRLIFSKSPYLLQHAENPVDWYPWGEEAFAKARAEDKPVLVSIGYSTCHWCHVMAHESFEDEEVARVLNRHFVMVKVDREERPDVDATYMAVCQMMTGSGGWPLNVVVTPDKTPFFAATYLPRTSRRGMAGLISVMEKIAQLWLTDRSRLLQTGEEVRQAILRLEHPAASRRSLDDAPLRQAYRQYLQTFDRQYAGFGEAPKFPAPHNISLLLRIGMRTGEEKAVTMAFQTLQAMRLGGIYDQIGFGLHRYSVDARWLVPHFEKMLYDQALLILASTEAFQASGDPFFAQTARETAEYILRDLVDSEGGLTCGEDADSEGAEGTFYLWTPDQVLEVLGEEGGAVFCRTFDITGEGNFEGKNIPHLQEDLGALAGRAEVPPEQLAVMIEEGRDRLFRAREERIRPHRDDKILTGWNGLAIAALSRAGAVLGEDRFVIGARRAADFVLQRMQNSEGRLLRRYRQGESVIPAFLEDYAFLAWGLIELHQAAFVPEDLKGALALTEEMERLFSDGEGGYFDTGADAEKVLTRGRSLQDGAIPSGISVAALNLLRLGSLTGDQSLEERGERLLGIHMDQVARYPSAYSQFLIALDFALGPRTEVVLSGEDESVREFLAILRSRFLPGATILLRRPGDEKLATLVPTVRDKGPVDGRSAAWVCRDRTCLPPVTSAEELEKLLEEKP